MKYNSIMLACAYNPYTWEAETGRWLEFRDRLSHITRWRPVWTVQWGPISNKKEEGREEGARH